jgi:hypothetical protein
MTKWANSEIHVIFKDFYMILYVWLLWWDSTSRYGGLTGLHGIETWKEATNMGNNDQKREATHQNESKSGFHTAKSLAQAKGKNGTCWGASSLQLWHALPAPPNILLATVPLPSPICLFMYWLYTDLWIYSMRLLSSFLKFVCLICADATT